MTTTSLEVSRQLQDAGFWNGDRDPANYGYAFDVKEMGTHTEKDYDRPYITEYDLYEIPAATLDDLVPALGLDKPFAQSDSMFMDLRDGGLTPDTLARVWLDANDKKALPDMIITKPPTEAPDA